MKQVVLFSSGVGYFEHFGTVRGDGTTELRFKTDQINDVLKSLVLQDLDQGQVGTVSYPSQEPVAKTLKSFQVDITSNPPLAELLNQLRGARITVTLAEGNVKGTIVGVEKRQDQIGDKPQIVEYWLLNLKVGPRFRSIGLNQVRDFSLEDPKLEAELDKALAAWSQARDQEKKPVTIHFKGKGERRVRVGYVVETPIWKTSYGWCSPGRTRSRLSGREGRWRCRRGRCEGGGPLHEARRVAGGDAGRAEGPAGGCVDPAGVGRQHGRAVRLDPPGDAGGPQPPEGVGRGGRRRPAAADVAAARRPAGR